MYFKVFLQTCFFKLKKGGGKKSQKPVGGFYEMYFHKPCCAASAAAHLNSRYALHRIFFGNAGLSEKQCCFWIIKLALWSFWRP